jgi:imidazolonepropionase-like amidohydrolase
MKKSAIPNLLFPLNCLFLLLFLTSSGVAQTKVIQGGTLIDGTGGAALENSVIVIRGERIAAVGRRGEVEIPQGSEIINVEGKHVLPALIDGHIHNRGWDGELFLAHGITTVVDLGNLTEWIMAQKDGLNRGKIRGPRMMASGSSIRGPYPSEKSFRKIHHIIVESPEEARQEARKRIQAGADVLKVYDGLTSDMLKAIIAEARQAGLPVAGHSANAWEAVEVGYDMIVHTPGIAQACLPKGTENEGGDPHARMSFEIADKLIEAMVAKGVYLNPTMRSAWNWAYRDEYQYEDFHLLFNDKNLRYIPLNFRLGILREYNRIGEYALQDLPPDFKAMKLQAHRNMIEFVKRFAAKGGKVMVGSDTLSTSGLSLHQELQMMVDYVGLSPLQALLTVTKHPAEMYRVTDRLGSVEEGKLADLLVIQGNPLENIRNTRNVEMLFRAGQLVDISYHPNYRNPIPKSTPEDTGHLIHSPSLEDLSPKVLTEEQEGAVLTLYGSGFTRYSLVGLKGRQLVPDFVSPFELRVEIPVELLGEAGTFPLTVTNVPGPIGTTSAAGQTALRHLGPRDETSNPFNLIVRFK